MEEGECPESGADYRIRTYDPRITNAQSAIIIM